MGCGLRGGGKAVATNLGKAEQVWAASLNQPVQGVRWGGGKGPAGAMSRHRTGGIPNHHAHDNARNARYSATMLPRVITRVVRPAVTGLIAMRARRNVKSKDAIRAKTRRCTRRDARSYGAGWRQALSGSEAR